MNTEDIQVAIEHLHISIRSISQALRTSPKVEEEDLKIYGPNGEVALRISDYSIRILSSSGVEEQVVGRRQPGPSNLLLYPVAGTAGASYTGTEQTLLNNLVTAHNELAFFCQVLQTALRNHGLIT
jgi:hypothetical protein